MGDVPVADLLASEARRSPHAGVPRGGARSVADDPSYSLSRAINRESHAGLNNSLKSYIVGLFGGQVWEVLGYFAVTISGGFLDSRWEVFGHTVQDGKSSQALS